MASDVSSLPSTPRQGILKSAQKSDDGPKKLPRPIVFWSLNEKTAYRRNRVVQTRMNMVMEDISTQRETSRKTIRYEAHKFRQKNSRYYSHPLGTSAEKQAAGMNIAPPNWKPPGQRDEKPETKRRESVSEDDLTSDDEDGSTESSPRKKGIITRAKKPAVSFSVFNKVQTVEDDLTIDDLDNLNTNGEVNTCKFSKSNQSAKIRSVSAMQHRDIPDLPGQNVKRQQSAFPTVRSNLNDGEYEKNRTNRPKTVRPNTADCYSEYAREANENRPHTVGVLRERRSENYFDKSKAAYQLRQDLKKRAKVRKQGVKTSVFTLQDALNLEKENFLKSKDKVVDYINRIEALKKSERTVVNRWTVRQLAAT